MICSLTFTIFLISIFIIIGYRIPIERIVDMFGYVTVHKPELKIKDFGRYHAYYCGLCHTLKEKHGFLGQMTLTYDMTFLVILLTSLYESDTNQAKRHCIVHPVRKHEMLENEITQYAADMNIALAYHNFLDDWEDEKKVSGFAGAKVMKSKYKKIEAHYERQCSAIERALLKLAEYEKKNEKSLDLVSGCFGELMAELIVYKQDNWEPYLRRFGFFLGKFIYLMDAYADLEKDVKNNSYNPLIWQKDREDFEEFCHEMLTMMISEAANEFEKLPCILDVDILRNILYGGVWTKYTLIREKKGKETQL